MEVRPVEAYVINQIQTHNTLQYSLRMCSIIKKEYNLDT